MTGVECFLWLRPVAMSLLCNVAVQRAADASSRATPRVALSEIACFPCATVWLRADRRARARTVAHRRLGELGAGELQSWETGIYETGEPGQVQMSPYFKLFGFIAQKCGSAHPRAHRRLQGALQRCSAPTSQRCNAEGSRAKQGATDARIADISLVPIKVAKAAANGLACVCVCTRAHA